jgi:anti-anti-sigma factor
MNGAYVIDGEMTIYRATELRAALQAALAAGGGDFALDLSAVTEIDCAGVQLLVAAAKSAAAAQRTLRLSSLGPAVAETLRFLDLDLESLAQEHA